uniref:Uncharacterized protein n=1 Tax=Rhizophora mucronata TaxID=61149 RepID=A0A2P2IRZ7_RHIMU
MFSKLVAARVHSLFVVCYTGSRLM